MFAGLPTQIGKGATDAEAPAPAAEREVPLLGIREAAALTGLTPGLRLLLPDLFLVIWSPFKSSGSLCSSCSGLSSSGSTEGRSNCPSSTSAVREAPLTCGRRTEPHVAASLQAAMVRSKAVMLRILPLMEGRNRMGCESPLLLLVALLYG